MSGCNNSKMRMLWGILLVSLVGGWAHNAYADGGDLAWAKHAGGMSYEEFGFGVATYPDGTCVVTGNFGNGAIFGKGEDNETILYTEGWGFWYDIFVAKYNADGSLAWIKDSGGVHWDSGRDIASYPDGTCVVTGYFRWDIRFGEGEENETLLLSPGDWDMFVAKYNVDGTLAWAKRAGGTEVNHSDRCYGYGIASYSDGTSVVTGGFIGDVTFGGEITLTAGSSDMFVAKYNVDGTLAWAKRAGGTGDDLGFGVASYSDGTSVVSGYFEGVATFGAGEDNETTLTSPGSYDIFVAKYNADGTLAWAKRAGGASEDNGYGITSYSDGTSIVTGYFEGTATFGEGEENEITLISAGWWDIFVAKYNNDGALAWVRSVGSVDWDSGFGIDSYSDGTSIVTGYFEGTATFGEGEENEITLNSTGGGGDDDIFVAKYNADGTLVWAKRAGGGRPDFGMAVASYPNGTSAVTGCIYKSSTPAVFGEGEENETTLISTRGRDIFVAKYYDSADGGQPVPEEPIDRLAKWNPTSEEWEPVGLSSITSGKVHVITHGWGRGTLDWVEDQKNNHSNPVPKIWEILQDPSEDFFDGLHDMAITISNSYNLLDDYCVLTYSWIDQSATEPLPIPENAKKSAKYRDVAGINLAVALSQAGINSVFSANGGQLHLLGHSHGARVNTVAALALENANVQVDHLTYCDSPERSISDNWYEGAYNHLEELLAFLDIGREQDQTFIDNYWTLFGKSYCGFDVVNTTLRVLNHRHPIEWYTYATEHTENQRREAIWWSPLKGSIYMDMATDYKRSGSDNYGPLEPTGGFCVGSNTLHAPLDLTTIGTEGTVSETENGVQLTESSPAFWHAFFIKEEENTAISFDYQFLTIGDGDELGILIDDEVRFIMPGTVAGPDEQSTTIDISDLEPGEHKLTIALHSVGQANADVLVSNIMVISLISNTPPNANAGNDQTVPVDSNCLATVVLDASDSNDVDTDDILTYSWSESGQQITAGINPTVQLDLGVHTIELIVNDGQESSLPDEVVITVEDNTPPEITLNGSYTITLECSVDSYTESGATTDDNCDGDIPVVIDGDTVDTSTCGTYAVTYDATDDSGNSATQVTRTVIVQDTVPPELSVSVESEMLWPSNHKMVEVLPFVSVSDGCDDDVDVSITVTSNEDDNGKGDGNRSDDIEVTEDGRIFLRAERSGKGDGRVYTIIYKAIDDAGNETQATATVAVPHNQP